MRESVAYDIIMEEGAIAHAHKLILRMGSTQFGAPSPEQEAQLRAIENLPRLDRLSSLRLQKAKSWEALLRGRCAVPSMKKILLSILLVVSCGSASAAEFVQPDAKALPDLFVWTDTCNVWVLRDGEAALLVNLGDGSVLEHLAKIGVKRVEWVLFTDHHREQCQGAPKLVRSEGGTKVAAPEVEKAFFETPTQFRKMNVSLRDAYAIHGTSYLRPPILPIPLDRTFAIDETFVWHGRKIACLDTRGTSPGGMTYRLQENGHAIAFSGDVMLDGAKMHTWFDTEWDYGFAAGIRALRKSVARLSDSAPAWLLPSHGSAMPNPAAQLRDYQAKLQRFEALYVRGYRVEDPSAFHDTLSKPTIVPDVAQVSPHLFKFKRKKFWPNFGLILADSGRAMVVDCGLLDIKFLDESLEGMRKHYGLKAIDAVVISHMHGDHFLEASHLREKWGTKIWALDRMVEKMEHPERFDYAAPIQAYGKKAADGTPIRGVRVDRGFKSGETFDWEGHKFTIDWMPGQTEFALCIHGQIDGRKVAFTGDNIFGDPEDPRQTGHEAVVAHNSAIFEEGYIYGAEYLKKLKPDLLMGGHSFVMDRPTEFIERYRKWSYEMRDSLRTLSSENDYRYWFDPFWVRAEPYRSAVKVRETIELKIEVRNFQTHGQTHRIEIHTPPGLIAEPRFLEGQLAAEARAKFTVRLTATPGSKPGVQLVAFDISRDGKRKGQLFDAIIEIVP